MLRSLYDKCVLSSRLKRFYSLLTLFLTIISISAFAGQAPTLPIPPDSSFTPPSPNACQSDYDQFYIAEPGVYAYWALCEVGSNSGIFDYAGRFDLSSEEQRVEFRTRYDSGWGPWPGAGRRARDPSYNRVIVYSEPGYSNEY